MSNNWMSPTDIRNKYWSCLEQSARSLVRDLDKVGEVDRNAQVTAPFSLLRQRGGAMSIHALATPYLASF